MTPLKQAEEGWAAIGAEEGGDDGNAMALVTRRSDP
jgi:hypothetical protein